jgi:hypothetical protein
MNNNEHYTPTVIRCESTAKQNGHVLDVWYPVSEHLHASLCGSCGAMVWVTRPGKETRWRIGGSGLEQDCLEEDLRSAAGD